MLICNQIRTGPRSNSLENLNSNILGRKDHSSYSGLYRQTGLIPSQGKSVTVQALNRLTVRALFDWRFTSKSQNTTAGSYPSQGLSNRGWALGRISTGFKAGHTVTDGVSASKRVSLQRCDNMPLGQTMSPSIFIIHQHKAVGPM